MLCINKRLYWTWQADEADVAAAEGKTTQLLRNTHRFWGEA